MLISYLVLINGGNEETKKGEGGRGEVEQRGTEAELAHDVVLADIEGKVHVQQLLHHALDHNGVCRARE